MILNLQVPVLGKNILYFADENEEAQETGSLSNIKLSPKRITGFLDVPFSYFFSNSESTEQALIEDLEAAMYDCLESVLLGNTATEKGVKGIFTYTDIPQTTINSYTDIITANSYVDSANGGWKRSYIISNSLKNYLRTLSKGDNKGYVLESNEIDGEKAYSASNCLADMGIYTDLKNLVIGSWAGTSILVDGITQRGAGNIRLTVNGFYDAVVAHPECVSIIKLPETTNNKV